MSLPSTSIPSGSLVLVTGGTGFVASHIIQEFLQRGYRVRGTVRDLDQASWLIDKEFKSHAENGSFQLVSVPDISVKGAFDDAIKGVSAIAHVASILSFDPNPNNVVPQTVASVTSVLTAASKEPSVKEVVFTSSALASMFPGVDRDAWVDQNTLNEAAVEAAWAPPPYEPSRIIQTYVASKVASEKAIWQFVQDQNPRFTVNIVSPSSITGLPRHQKHAESAGNWVATIFKGDRASLEPFFSAFFVDVQDIAVLHVAAILDPEIKNTRLHSWGHSANWNDFLAILRKLRPQRTFMPDWPESYRLSINTYQSNSVALLKKWANQDGWKPLRDSISETVENPYFKLE